jgi:hypothetical protein
MLCLVPLILFTGMGGIARALPIMRTWVVMMAASLVTYSLDPQSLAMPYHTYFLIDLLAGLAIAAPQSGLAQRIIAAGFVIMAVFDAGAAFINADGLGLFDTIMRILGWAMWLVLLVWGAHDAGRGIVAYFGGGGADAACPADRQTARQRASGIVEP